MSQQTRLDQFYRVVSQKSTKCGIKQSEVSTKRRGKSLNTRRPKLSILKMSPVVKSEVQIIDEVKPSKGKNVENSSQKRKPSQESGNSPKKHKVENTSTNDVPTHVEVLSQSNKNSPEKKSSLTPQKTPTKSNNSSPTKSNSGSPTKSKFSPRKLHFADRINTEKVEQAIENFNLTRQGSIIPNEFDLESIYQAKEFSFSYSGNTTSESKKFVLKDIVFPKEKHADHLLTIITDVFSIPTNCGYFSKEELDLIFSLITLAPESQMLFVRLLKRKLGWHRTSSIKYPEVADNLDPFFKELVEHKFCSSDLESTESSILLNMLSLDEVRSLCQKLKIDHKGNKSVMIGRLLKYGSTKKSFFFGAKSPEAILRSMILLLLQPCVCLPEDIVNLFDKVLTLFHPVQDPTESIADLFLTLTNVHKGDILFPPIDRKDHFPIFQNRVHLTEFVKSKNALREVHAAIEKKDWDAVRDLGRLALKQLTDVDKNQKESSLPLHVKKFAPEYAWAKVMSISVDAFKKTPETIAEAVNILETLINDEQITQSSKGRWYNELALIEMHHRKDLEKSAELTLHALQKDTLTEVDVSGLLERLRKLMRRKTGISAETKQLIQKTQEDLEAKGLFYKPPVIKTITANMANRAESGGKSTWSVTMDGNNKYYGSVEVLALQHYTTEEDFIEGLHCEGSLPITIFTVFFWDELYNSSIPGVFVSSYQDAPLDLFTAEFFDNRKKAIEDKIQVARALDLESFSSWMQERYSSYVQYRSVMPNTLFKDDLQFKDVITCVGIDGVVGICERLVSNFRLWRSGFPDLIVWNTYNSKCKIVEVKGPGDSLSEKQKLWLQYLERLEIPVEVCHVEAASRGSK